MELSGSATTISTGTFTAKKYLFVQHHCINDGAIYPNMRFNADSGSNYAYRFSGDGGTDATAISQSLYRSGGSIGSSVNQSSSMYIINVATKEKLITNHFSINRTAGAGTAPFREENVGKWTNTSDQITSIVISNGQGGNYASGSRITVWGAD